MASKIELIVEAIDKASPTIKKIDKNLESLSGSFPGDELGASFRSFQEDLANGEMLFAPAIKRTKELTEETKKLSDSFIRVGKSGLSLQTQGLFTAAGAAYAVVLGLKEITKQLNDVVKLSKEQPELFDSQQLANIRAYGTAADELNKTFQELKISVASAIAPTFTSALADTNQKIKEQGVLLTVLKFGFDDVFRYLFKAEDAYASAAESVESYDRAIQNQRGVHIQLRDDLKKDEQAYKELESSIKAAISTQNSFYSGQISQIETIANKRESAEQQEANLMERRQKLQDELTQNQIYTGQLWNSISNKRKGANQQELAQINRQVLRTVELKGQIADLDVALSKMGETSKKQFNQMVADALKAKLAADGVVTESEQLYLLGQEKQLGIIQQSDIDLWKSVNDEAAKLASQAPKTLTPLEQGFMAINKPMQTTKDLMDQIYSYNGKSVSFEVYFNTITAMQGITGGINTSAPLLPGFGRTQRREIGGPVMANQAYLVGERGPEMFVPNQSGNIISNDRMSSPVINVYATVRNDNDIDYIAQEVARRIT